MTKALVTGVSGTGKSSIVRELNERGVASFDMDLVPDLCHWRHKKTGKRADYFSGVGRGWIEAHEWLCDTEEVKKLFTKDETVVVAGLASNQDDFLHLFDEIILLRCDKRTLLDRLRTRQGEEEFGKTRDVQEYILRWCGEFEERMRERGEYGSRA